MSGFWLQMTIGLLVGLGLGAVYFTGLWVTIQAMMGPHPIRMFFLISFLIRVIVVLGGAYWICGPDWHCWIAVLTGFLIIRSAFLFQPYPRDRQEPVLWS